MFSCWSLFPATLNLFSLNKAFYWLIPLEVVSSIWDMFNEQSNCMNHCARFSEEKITSSIEDYKCDPSPQVAFHSYRQPTGVYSVK